jgi:ligand-binding sensor domain-containing protein/putative methionine-R-sulfoxide reductase with GAF domain
MKQVLIGCFFSAIAMLSFGQVISSDAPFVHYTSSDGLSQQVVRSIVQDQEGFIWIGTEDGLNKFDGYDFKQFRSIRNDNTSLPDNFIYALYPSSDGGIWIGTNSAGLAKYDPVSAEFMRYSTDPNNPSALKGERIYTLYEDADGIVWVGTYNGGMARFDPQTGLFKNYIADGKPGSILSNMVVGIQRSSDGTLWVRTSDALQKFEEQTETFIHVDVPVLMPDLEMRGSFYIDEDDKIWTSLGAAILVVDAKTEQYDIVPFSNFDNEGLTLLKIIPFNKDYLWVSSLANGLFLFNKETNQAVSFRHNEGRPSSISSGGIVALLQDRSGSLWTGGLVSGISKLNINRKKFHHYKSKPEDPSTIRGNTVRSMLIDSQNNMWVGYMTDPNALLDKLVFTNDKYELLNSSTVNLGDAIGVTCLLEDSNGNIWVGTWGAGIHILPYGDTLGKYEIRNTGMENSLSDDIIQAFYEDRFGNIWIGTETALDLYNPQTGEIKNFFHDPENDNSLAQYGVQANTIVEDAYGCMWIGTWGGLTRMIPKDNTVNSFDVEYDFVRYNHDPENENTISDNRIISLYYDKFIDENEIYAGTYGSGLNRIKFDPEDNTAYTVEIYTRNEGLSNDVVYTILSDNNGELWVSTNSGLNKFNPNDNSFNVYDVNDGLQGNQFFWGARFKTVNGELMFGGLNGFNLFNPDDIVSDQTIPSVVFTDLKVLNKSVGVGEKINKNVILEKGINRSEKITLTHRENVFTIEFAGLHYAFPDNNHYRYMMEGFDEDFIEVDSRKRFASYTNLDPGVYTFKVDASNYDGVWTNDPIELEIYIKPPFWKRWWFRIMVLLLLIYGVYQFIQRRMEMVKRDKEILEGKIKQGEKIIEEKVQEVDKQQEEIKKRDIQEQEMRFMNRGLAKFSEILASGDKNLQDMSQTIISELVTYTGGVMGVLYVYQDSDDQDQYLKQYGTYAPDEAAMSRTHVKVGEGYVGTCFFEGKTIIIDDVPDDYSHLSSGLGDVKPGSICLIPIRQSDNKQGVIEIASLAKLETYKIQFIEKVGENITSVISIRKAGEKLNELLEQSHQQTEELRSQEEEMRQNMEEMYATQEEMARREEDWTKEKEEFMKNEASYKAEVKQLKEEIKKLKK